MNKNLFCGKKTETIAIFLSTLLLLNSCLSVPVRTIPKLDQKYDTAIMGNLTIAGCDKLEPNQCAIKYSEILRTIEKTHLFNKISFNQNGFTDYVITIEPYHKNRYGIGHNPAFFVLSIVIPFWEKVEYGYNFTRKDVHRDKVYKISAKESGTNIMWSGSLLINMLPSRGLPITSSNNEVTYLRNTIINTLKK